jgi:hypothetical protein
VWCASLVRREFIVEAPRQRAWDHLANVEAWTSWARHIKRVTLDPPGPLTSRSAGSFRLAGAARSTFRMEQYEPPTRWQWVGRFLAADVHYDHRFEPIDDHRTRLRVDRRRGRAGRGFPGARLRCDLRPQPRQSDPESATRTSGHERVTVTRYSPRRRAIGHHAYSRARRLSKVCPSSPVTCRSPSTGS